MNLKLDAALSGSVVQHFQLTPKLIYFFMTLRYDDEGWSPEPKVK